jgi:hypothetical protein
MSSTYWTKKCPGGGLIRGRLGEWSLNWNDVNSLIN